MTKANMSEFVTLRIPVLSDIEAIADATERSRSFIIVRALRNRTLVTGDYLLDYSYDGQQVEGVSSGWSDGYPSI